MKTFLVNYTETFTGQVEVQAASEAEAMDIIRSQIESDELIPSDRYDGHDVTIDFAEEV